MSNVQYRHWQPGDDEGVMRILAPTGWCTPERYATKFDDPGLRPADILIAEQAGQIVGHLMLPRRRVRFDDTSLPLGGVGMVVVDPAVRGQGVGARLLDAALAHHRAAGNALAGLFTQPSLAPAYAMYRRRGFTPVAQRLTLTIPVAALPAPAGWRARPLQASDRPAVARLVEDWGRQHRGVGTELLPAPPASPWVVGTADRLAGAFELLDRPQGQLAARWLVAPDVPSSAVLAAALAAGALAVGDGHVRVVTNTGNRLHAELAPLASRIEPSESTFMVAPLRLTPILAGLALEVARQLRQAGAGPVAATLALAETGERVRLVWERQVLTVADPRPADDPAVALTAATLALGLMGQPAAAPEAALAPLWAALFPPRPVEMHFIHCW